YVGEFQCATRFGVASSRDEKPAYRCWADVQSTVSTSHFGAGSGGLAMRMFRFRRVEMGRMCSWLGEKASRGIFVAVWGWVEGVRGTGCERRLLHELAQANLRVALAARPFERVPAGGFEKEET